MSASGIVRGNRRSDTLEGIHRHEVMTLWDEKSRTSTLLIMADVDGQTLFKIKSNEQLAKI